jgi:hypothetical protein
MPDVFRRLPVMVEAERLTAKNAQSAGRMQIGSGFFMRVWVFGCLGVMG